MVRSSPTFRHVDATPRANCFRTSRSVLSRFERIGMLFAERVCEVDCCGRVRIMRFGMPALRVVDARDREPRATCKIRVGNVALLVTSEVERLAGVRQRSTEEVRAHLDFGARDQRARAGASAALSLSESVDHLSDRGRCFAETTLRRPQLPLEQLLPERHGAGGRRFHVAQLDGGAIEKGLSFVEIALPSENV